MKVRHHYIFTVIVAILICGIGLLSSHPAGGWVFSDSRSVKEPASEPVSETKDEPVAAYEATAAPEPVCPPDTNPPTLPQPDINPLNPNPNNPFYLNNPP